MVKRNRGRIGGSSRGLVDAKNGRISREIFVSKKIFQQELERPAEEELQRASGDEKVEE